MRRVTALLALLALLLTMLPASTLAAPRDAAAREAVIVVFHDSVASPTAATEDLGRRHGFGAQFVYQHALKGFAASVPSGALNALARDPRVAWIEADQAVHAYADPDVPTGIERIFADDNAEITINGADDQRINVDVAIIDTGIDLDHPDLNVNLAGSVNCLNSSGGPPFSRTYTCSSGGDDDNEHGTHVAGTVGALDNGVNFNGVDVVGVAPGARLWAVKVLDANGSGSLGAVTAGIEYVTKNAPANGGPIKVANMSLGCECSSLAMDTAIANSVEAGVTYAVAAGNSNADAETHSPANHPDVITVSALADFDGLPGALGSPTCRTDQDDTLADFSNFGEDIEIAAPGVCILSTVPGGGYDNTFSGTSMASPHVAGAAALLASSANYTPDTIAGIPGTIEATLIAEGNDDWTDDSGDNFPEPLLDVGNAAVFNPATVDGSEPGSGDASPTVSIVSPVDGSTVSGAVTIQVDADDAADAAGTLDVEIGIDGVFAPATYNDGFYELGWTTTGAAEGSHTIDARATDGGGNITNAAQVQVTVDNVDEAPSAAIVNPADDSTVAGMVVVQVDADDPEDAPGTLTVTVTIGDTSHTAAYNEATGYYEYGWDTTGLVDGSVHTIDAQALDSGGNPTAATPISVTVDNSTPATMHVESLTGSSDNNGSTWIAMATIVVHDSADDPVPGVIVKGHWSNGTSGTDACTTDSNGTCTISKAGILKRVGSVQFTIDGLEDTLEWDGSGPTRVTVLKP